MSDFPDRNNTLFLRFLAIVLIVNSHLDSLYPFAEIATGGAIGNSLFFMLSGYGLMLSEQRATRSFFRWYMRRIVRIYPTLFLVVMIDNFILENAFYDWGAMDYIKSFVWPTPNWFISAIMLFYIVFFILMKQKNSRIFLLAIGMLTIPYGYLYLTMIDLSRYSIEGLGYFKWIFYLQIMLFGGYIAINKKKN